METQKYKWKLIYLLIISLLIVLWVYSNLIGSEEGFFSMDRFIGNPQKYGDYQMEVMGRITYIGDDYFILDVGSFNIKIYGKGVKKPILGESVFYLNFKKDGSIEMMDYHNYNFNYILYAVSFIALVLFIFIFFKEWKITKRGFEDA